MIRPEPVLPGGPSTTTSLVSLVFFSISPAGLVCRVGLSDALFTRNRKRVKERERESMRLLPTFHEN